jgi:hypothetical protein
MPCLLETRSSWYTHVKACIISEVARHKTLDHIQSTCFSVFFFLVKRNIKKSLLPPRDSLGRGANVVKHRLCHKKKKVSMPELYLLYVRLPTCLGVPQP